MPGFYIESITAHSVEKNDAVVSFGKGLNVIQGFSDTGKTFVLKCIDYIFGSTEIPFDNNTGYNTEDEVQRYNAIIRDNAEEFVILNW